MDRRAWLLEVGRADERQEDVYSPVYDEQWGEIGDTHRDFLTTILSKVPEGGRILDAACGTGKYVQMVLASGRSVLGTDHSAGQLRVANEKFPEVPTEKHELRDLPFEETFDGVICVDAMEFVPPEDWPIVLERFRSALRPEGWLYLTIERVDPSEVLAATERTRASGLPVVEGEALWDDPEGAYYHHYPSMDRVRGWLTDAGFEIVEEAEGPWEDEGYAYHHVLARAAAASP
jgi:cyclopropane fatty-acyl-phospholipid synthase-like methyltransferase